MHMRQEASNPLELEAVKVTLDGQWAPNLGLLQGKYVLLTAEPMFQPPGKSSIFIFWEGVRNFMEELNSCNAFMGGLTLFF